MYWTEQHNIILCREVVFENPYQYKKGSPQRSETWKKIVDILNKCATPQFNVDQRAIRDHINVLINKYKKKIRAEERASGISPDEPSELDELLQQIIALEESAPTDPCSKDKAEKAERAKAEDVRMKAMERLSQTKKRESEQESDDKSKRARRTTGDAIGYLKERAEKNAEIREKELDLEKEKQQQQLQMQQQQADMLRLMHQQQLQHQQQQQQLQQQQMVMMQQVMGIMSKMLDK